MAANRIEKKLTTFKKGKTASACFKKKNITLENTTPLKVPS